MKANNQNKPEWYKRKWVWGLGIFIVLAGIGQVLFPQESQKSTDTKQSPSVAEQEKSTEQPKERYKFLSREVANNVRANDHYLLQGEKPSKEEAQNIIKDLAAKGCGEYKVCNYFVWDSQSGFNDRKDTTGMASEVAAVNKEHLAIYMNSGYAFYYYGSTGDGSGNVTIYSPDEKSFTNF